MSLPEKNRPIAIIGGGLAGTACAYMLKMRGLDPVIYEAGETLASGASGNSVGLYNPRFSAKWTPEARFYASAYDLALEIFEQLCHPERSEGSHEAKGDSSAGKPPQNDTGDTNRNDIDWSACGALHLIHDEKKDTRFSKTAQNWPWPETRLRLVSAADASEIAGVPITHDALYLADAGYVSPEKLCRALAHGVRVHTSAHIETLEDIEEEIIILAGGMGCLSFTQAAHLPLKPVRGQITHAQSSVDSAALKTNLCYGGYCTPAINGAHTIGASFQHWLDHDDIIAQDDLDNLGKLQDAVPDIFKDLNIAGHRAAVRTTTKDHFPVIGKLAGRANLYVSTGHGSHGILSGLLGAQIIADMITGKPPTLDQDIFEKLSPSRF